MKQIPSATVGLLAAMIWLIPPGATVMAQDAEESAAEQGEQRDEQGRQLYLSGAQAFEEGRFFDALDYFQTSYQLTQRPELLFNIGQTADRLRLDELAIESFQGYLGASPDAPNREAVLERLRILREAVAQREAEAASEVERDQERVALEEGANEEDETAQERAASAALMQGVGSAEPAEGGVLRKWWFWTVIGAVVAGGVAAGVLWMRPGEDDFIEGNLGSTVFTLRASP